MIVDIILTIIGWLISVLSFILPNYSIWDNSIWSFDEMFLYIGNALGKLNFIFAIDTFFQALDYFMTFEILFFTGVFIVWIINYVRGAGGIKI